MTDGHQHILSYVTDAVFIIVCFVTPPRSSGWHSGQGTIFGVFKLDFDSYERYLDFETGVLHRNSSRIYLAEWFGLGSHFGKTITQNMRKSYYFEKWPCPNSWKRVCFDEQQTYGRHPRQKIAFKYILDQFWGINGSRFGAAAHATQKDISLDLKSRCHIV